MHEGVHVLKVGGNVAIQGPAVLITWLEPASLLPVTRPPLSADRGGVGYLQPSKFVTLVLKYNSLITS
jgi:hypothetical protein